MCPISLATFSWFSGFGSIEWGSGRDGGKPAPVTYQAFTSRGGPGRRRPVLCSCPNPELSLTKRAVSKLGPGGNFVSYPWEGQLCHPVPGQAFVETHSPTATSNPHWDQRPELSDWGALSADQCCQSWSQHRWEKFSSFCCFDASIHRLNWCESHCCNIEVWLAVQFSPHNSIPPQK